MKAPIKLTRWVEEHFEISTSYGLEVRQSGEPKWGVLETRKTEDIADPAVAADEIALMAADFRANNAGGKWRAMLRIKDPETGEFERIRLPFFIPHPAGNAGIMPIPSEDIDPQIAIFMQVMNSERERTDNQLAIASEREAEFHGLIVELIQETRADRIDFLQEMREARTSHDDRVGPIIDGAVNALAKATELVSVHQENNTVVQLAKLAQEAKDKEWEMYLELGGPLLKRLAERFGKRGKKPQTPTMDAMPQIEEPQDPPRSGPTRELFFIIEKLPDAKIEELTKTLPEGVFEKLDAVANGGDDGATTVVLAELKSEYEKLGKIKGLGKLVSLGNILGEELGERFIALFNEDLEVPAPEPEPDNVVQLRKKEGYVAGLRDAGFINLDDEKQVAIAKQFGPPLAGVLIGAAEGDDEDKAFAAICTLGARLKELHEKNGEDDVDARLNAVLTVLGDDEGLLVELISKVADELEPE